MDKKKGIKICLCNEAKQHCELTCTKWEDKKLPDKVFEYPFWNKHKEKEA